MSKTLAGIQRSVARAGQRPRKRKAAAIQVLRRLLEPMGEDLVDLRDRTLLLVGFAGAQRRSELAATGVTDLKATERGMRLILAQKKVSQIEAVTVLLPYRETELCPVRAPERWPGNGYLVPSPPPLSENRRRAAM